MEKEKKSMEEGKERCFIYILNTQPIEQKVTLVTS